MLMPPVLTLDPNDENIILGIFRNLVWLHVVLCTAFSKIGILPTAYFRHL